MPAFCISAVLLSMAAALAMTPFLPLTVDVAEILDFSTIEASLGLACIGDLG